MRLAPGTRLGPYDVLALLGAGGMGEVYRARDTATRRQGAVLQKLLIPRPPATIETEHARAPIVVVEDWPTLLKK